MPSRTIDVHILEQSYRVACSEEEEIALLAAAKQLNERMRTIQRAGKVVGVERIAIMAGINLAHEFNKLQNSAPGSGSGPANASLARCHALVDAMLDDAEVSPAASEPTVDDVSLLDRPT